MLIDWAWWFAFNNIFWIYFCVLGIDDFLDDLIWVLDMFYGVIVFEWFMLIIVIDFGTFFRFDVEENGVMFEV